MLNSKTIFASIGVLALSACGGGNGHAPVADSEPANRSVSMTIGEGQEGATNLAINLPNVQGKLSLPAIRLNPREVDIDGVGLYPGSRVTGLDIAGEDGVSEGSVAIRFDSSAPPAVIRDYFVKAFAEKGISVKAAGNRITGRDKSGKPFSISMIQEEGVTRGVVKVGNRAS
jgi:hypothetical protein